MYGRGACRDAPGTARPLGLQLCGCSAEWRPGHGTVQRGHRRPRRHLRPTREFGPAGPAAARGERPESPPDRSAPDPLPAGVGRSAVDDLPDDTVRAKGIAEGPDGSRLLIQQVGRRRRIGPLPQAEDQEPTDLVVIRFSRPEPLRVQLGRTPS